MPRRFFLIGTVCLACLIPSGCGDKPPKPEVSVRGQILYRGEPLSGGMIVFAPHGERGMNGPLATATLNTDGSFTLVGADGKPVPAGWYRIAVAPRAGSVPLPTVEHPYPGLPAKFRNPSSSGLECEVKP